jgi:hypothetical protein
VEEHGREGLEELEVEEVEEHGREGLEEQEVEEHEHEGLEVEVDSKFASTTYAPIQEDDVTSSCHVCIHGRSGCRAIVHSRNQQFRI